MSVATPFLHGHAVKIVVERILSFFSMARGSLSLLCGCEFVQLSLCK